MATDMASLQTYVPPAMVKRLKYVALVEGRSVSDIVRDLVSEYLDQWADADGNPAPALNG